MASYSSRYFSKRVSESSMTSIHLDILCDHSPNRRKVNHPSSILHNVITISSSFSVNNLNLIDSRPKDVIFVIDKSGSMEGPRMDRSKAAINHVIDALLAPMDRIGVVAFSSSVSVISSLDYATDIPTLHNRVNNIVAEGGTNIHQGLLEALQQFDNDVTSDPTRQRLVILLSDGEHNEGPLVISEISSVCSQKQLSGIFCIGIDDQADIKTLSIIASECQGQFWSTNNMETLQQDLIRSFSKCFCGILSSFGKNLILKIENLIPNQIGKLVYSDFSNSFKMIDSVSSTAVSGEVSPSSSIIEIHIGQLISEQTIHLILGFDILPSSKDSSFTGKEPVLKFSLEYYDLFQQNHEKIEKLVSWPLSFASPPQVKATEEKVDVDDHRYRLVLTKEDPETHNVEVVSEEMISLSSEGNGFHLHVPSDLMALLYFSDEKGDEVIEFHSNSNCFIERVTTPLPSSSSSSSTIPGGSSSSDGFVITLLDGKYYVNVNSYETRIYDEKDIFATSFSSIPPPPVPISATPTATTTKKGHVVASSASIYPRYLFLLPPSLAVVADKAAAKAVSAVSPAASAKPKVASSILSPSSFTSTSSATKKSSIVASSSSASSSTPGPRQNRFMIIEKQSKLRSVCLTGLIKVFEKKKEITTVPAFEEIVFLPHSSSSGSSTLSHSPPPPSPASSSSSLSSFGRPKALSSASPLATPDHSSSSSFQKLKEISKDHINDLLTSHLLRNELILDSCENHYLVRNSLKDGFYSLCTNFNPNMIKEYEEIINNVLKISFSYKLERIMKIPEISQNISLVKAFTVSVVF
jgi:uncharacterized protein YegL